MAEAPSLGDFFKSKGKKKIKATNLNKETAAAKPEDQKAKKATEDDAWQEEQIVAQTMKVEVVGKLMREEEKKDDEDSAAPAWGAPKKEGGSRNDLSDKKYPSLAKSVASINIDDGSDNKVNIATSKNVFAALEGDEEEDESGSKRPKAINSSMVSKKKGEFEKVALKREVDKYARIKKKKAQRVEDSGEEEDEEEDEESEEETAEVAEVEEKQREKKEKKKEAKQEVEDDETQEKEEVEEDLKMQPDLLGAKEKYKGRKKMPVADLPREEMREEKENQPANQQSGGKKKKFVAEEETDKKIAYADW